MAQRTLEEMPNVDKIAESIYDLDFIRRKISGLKELAKKERYDREQLLLLDLILCLANEIDKLKHK